MEYQPLQVFEKPVTDYLRVATVSPEVAIADVPANVQSTLEAYEAAKAEQAELVVCPELGLTGYSTADLFHNQHVLEQTEYGLAELAARTENGPALIVGAPLRHNNVLYNCAVMLAEGKVAGVIPKVWLPNYNEFYEERWFSSGQGVVDQTMRVGALEAPFGTDVLFDINGTKVGAEICEDLFAPVNPATYAALSGAEVIVNLSASDEVIGKADYRRLLVAATSGKLITGYVYASAGRGESVADVVYGGHQLIGEAGRLVGERKPLSDDATPLVYDIDRAYIEHDRMTNKTWANQALQQQTNAPYRTIAVAVPSPSDNALYRRVEQSTHKPSNPERLDARCEEIFSIMSHALAQRISDAGAQSIVLGLSGGLDSTLALLTALEATKLLGKPASFIRTITMPGPASSERTQNNAVRLAKALGTTHEVIPIGDMSMDVLAAIGHDQQTEDITYENAQARMRTMLLMEYANHTGGFVQGTGDLSEKAIGWCTFNGDHTSMYNPSSGVPKSLVRNLVSWVAARKVDGEARNILHDIVATPISPELTGNGNLSQVTEDINGPYELIDFFHKELHRYGSRPTKIGYLALQAYGETYDEATIAQWLDGFVAKYTRSQWKRDVAPNGPKIGTVADSPRSDLRMAPNTSPNWYK